MKPVSIVVNLDVFERSSGEEIDVAFTGELRAEQAKAVKTLLDHDTGVLVAPTAFGKSVVGSYVIAQRRVSTLVLVHRNELVKQWRKRLQSFLDLPEGSVGIIGGGKRKPSGKIDVAVMQSIYRNAKVDDVVRAYGQVID